MASLLLWLDLEMTGLDPERCAIVEIATVVTDESLAIVAEGPALVIHAQEAVLAQMNDTVRAMHQKSGLIARIRASTTSLAHAEQATLAFVKRHCPPKSTPLCGNSIHKDRQFIERHMPALDGYLHYRNIDVSTIKELARRWYGERLPKFEKSDHHRALDDVKESIAELRYYRERIFRPEPLLS